MLYSYAELSIPQLSLEVFAELVMSAVQQNIWALKYASDELRNSFAFMMWVAWFRGVRDSARWPGAEIYCIRGTAAQLRCRDVSSSAECPAEYSAGCHNRSNSARWWGIVMAIVVAKGEVQRSFFSQWRSCMSQQLE